jgi:hypothetical protein
MGQRPNDAALKDAKTLPSREECVSNMEQSLNDAALKDAQINPNGEDYAGDTVHTATNTKKNLQLSLRALDLNLIRLL